MDEIAGAEFCLYADSEFQGEWVPYDDLIAAGEFFDRLVTTDDKDGDNA